LQKDANRNSLPPDFRLTTGSKVNVWGQLFAYNTGAVSGVGLRLRGVQVLELAEEASNDPFSATNGYTGGYTAAKQEDDPFGLPPVKPSAPAQSASNNVLEDQIPF
jgi:hypothetical protein